MSNVEFLKVYDQALVDVFAKAEEYVHTDPNTSLIKIRQFAEILAQFTAVRLGIPEWERGTQIDLLNLFKKKGVFGETALSLFHNIRKTGNKAVHGGAGSADEASIHLKMAWNLAVMFHRGFSRDSKFNPEFKLPKAAKHALPEMSVVREAAVKYQARAETAEREVDALREKLRLVEANFASQGVDARKDELRRVFQASNDLNLDEKTTRRLIDEQLRDAGWEADTENLRHSEGVRPTKGKNLAIAEWPTESGPADYALFCGLRFVGVVEAKKKSVDVKGKLDQSARYSKGAQIPKDVEQMGEWSGYKVPFLFSTNGRPYLEQLKEKSGIWFLDARIRTNLPRPLVGWPSPEGLLEMAQKDETTAIQNLRSQSSDYLPLREYQKKAVASVEEAIINGRREIMVAMATGTGKTRTCIGLTYRLIKAGRFRRILFVVDRTSLGSQASDSFKELKIEDNKSFAQIYDIKDLEDITPDTATKVHFATVQALIKRVLYPSDEEGYIPIDQYDCIIIDECHRGYTLDKELSEEEFEYRNEEDYISKYRRVIEYFDAVKIGLTATPALHTTQIFGLPVYSYSYREAVIDGFLVDHLDPYKIKTRLGQEGIKWRRGETVKVYDPESSSIEELANIPDELEMEIDDFNTKVITEDFNRKVCEQLAQQIEWDTREKTLIFCARDDHADLVVRLLNESFQKVYGEVDNEAVKKITANSDKPLELIKRFKNERFPSVAVTVDLLTTGIDVPQICNLVFIRRVKSRILYDQMIGRATRLCEEIGKEHFKIYDAVDLYESLQPFSQMKPVTPNPSVTLVELSNEWKKAKKDSVKKHIVDQIVAKLNARKRRIKGDALEEFKSLTGGQDPEELVTTLKSTRLSEQDWALRFEKLAAWLDKVREAQKKLLISEHQDEALGIEQGFGENQKPEDYLEGFAKFVKENLNEIQALTIIAKRPRDLTRQQLRELKLILDSKGYKEKSLQEAYKLKTNKDIAASLLGFIRREAIGDALIPFQERLNKAVETIKTVHNFTPVQIRWIDRIKAQIEKELVVDKDALDRGAFKLDGGFDRANKVFNGNIEKILTELNELIWQRVS